MRANVEALIVLLVSFELLFWCNTFSIQGWLPTFMVIEIPKYGFRHRSTTSAGDIDPDDPGSGARCGIGAEEDHRLILSSCWRQIFHSW